MQMLYQMQSQKDFSEEAFHRFAELQRDGKESRYFKTVYEKCRDHLDEIDAKINASSSGWRTARMPEVDLSILRLAVTEIDYLPEIPRKVSANEAVNLAKKFGTEKSARFINGVLGKILRDGNPEKRKSASASKSSGARKSEIPQETADRPEKQEPSGFPTQPEDHPEQEVTKSQKEAVDEA